MLDVVQIGFFGFTKTAKNIYLEGSPRPKDNTVKMPSSPSS